jgi:hypothetical protein
MASAELNKTLMAVARKMARGGCLKGMGIPFSVFLMGLQY